ncbi:MAG: aconitate hydratase AcnA [Planctomycetota bacterium]|nr:aconitate hydratase AcnA [Planctomycetota bacterium]
MSTPPELLATLPAPFEHLTYASLPALEAAGYGDLARLPYSIRVMLESVLRNQDGFVAEDHHLRALAGWGPANAGEVEVPYIPGRVVLQDFTGVPCVVDLAAMRAAMARLGGDPARINPQVPCDLVIDHSVQVDHFGSAAALGRNVELEYVRNAERYEFLKWGQGSLENLRVVPPSAGIVHQVNLEYLAGVVLTRADGDRTWALPDSVVGTDSHTTMVNGLGVVGWGVGGIEAEAVMLGQPVYMLLPEVVGFELTGRLPEGATATDLVLRVVEILREAGVVSKFVEFHGDGVRAMGLADRATIANMAPEYGATMGYFPVDAQTTKYLRLTGRSDEQVALVEAYHRAQGLWVDESSSTPEYSENLTLDLGSVVPSLAGPKRPQDRIELPTMGTAFAETLRRPQAERGFALEGARLEARAEADGHSLTHGSIVIAAITSCTNTSNPHVMIGAGLLAKRAIERGLSVPSFVKTSLAPGSRVVTDYLERAGLDKALDQLGFQTVGYGCTTCIGNSGPLPEPVASAITSADLVAASVLSGNRNFEGRINSLVKANYLASPPLVVAFALAGRIDLDLTTDPLGTDADGQPVYLRELWPTDAEIHATIAEVVEPSMFRKRYDEITVGTAEWRAIPASSDVLYPFVEASTYIQEPPFFEGMGLEPAPLASVVGARTLVMVGDSTTTDHISPAGAIQADGPAGRYLEEQGVERADFNSFGSRRGNDRVMTRGTFANVRLRNQLAPGTEGGVTRHLPSGEQLSIFDAAVRYRDAGTPLVVLAGKEYGTGSSRDWAAKGTLLLGVRMVLTESYERIHRSNLIGMGVLPLEYLPGETAASLGLTGEELFDLDLSAKLVAGQVLDLVVRDAATDAARTIQVRSRIDTPVEVAYFENGGILQTVLRRLAKD